MSETYYYGQGRLSVAPHDPPGPWRWIGDVSALSLKLSVEKVTHNESYSGQLTQTRVFPTKKTATLELTMHQIDPENLALALFGTTQITAGGRVEEEALGPLAAGEVFYLAHPGVAGLVVTDRASSPKALVPGTDYVVEDAAFGRCRLLRAVGFTPPFQAAYRYGERRAVGLFTAVQPTVAVRYDGVNLAEGQAPVRVDLYKVATDPLQELALISTGTEVAGLQVSGGILLDSRQPAAGGLGQFGAITQIVPAEAL